MTCATLCAVAVVWGLQLHLKCNFPDSGFHAIRKLYAGGHEPACRKKGCHAVLKKGTKPRLSLCATVKSTDCTTHLGSEVRMAGLRTPRSTGRRDAGFTARLESHGSRGSASGRA
eukprot:3450689-Prymnesium_polylepis.1